MRTYRVKLAGFGSEEVEADHYEIEAGGVLLFGDEEGLLVKGFGHGYWLSVESA